MKYFANRYFRALANGDIPPVKERLELATATQRTDTGLTPGLLRVLHRQLGPKRNVDVSLIEEKWKDVMLPKEQFDELLRIGNLTGVIEWYKFLAVGCSALAEVCSIRFNEFSLTLIYFRPDHVVLIKIESDLGTCCCGLFRTLRRR
jgi:hypothetical protein